MLRKHSIFFLVSLFILSFLAMSIACGEKAPKTYKIGAILSLTGDAARYGQWTKNGMELALEEINEQGGINGKKIEIIYEDSKGDPKESVAAMNKLVSIDKVPVILGPVRSVEVLACAPIAERTKTVLFNTTASSPKITQAGDYVFRNRESSELNAYAMAGSCYKELGFRKVAILYVNSANGIGYKNVFEKHFKELGGTILAIDSYEPEASDFRSQLTKLNKLNPEAIYVPGLVKETGHILKQAKEFGVRSQFLGTIAAEAPELLNIAGNAAEGFIYTAPAFDPHSPDKKMQEYQAKYKAKYGEESGVFAALGYDGLKIVALAIQKGGYNAEGIKNALYSIKDYPGAAGKTTFDENGDVYKPMVLKTVRNGQFVSYK